VTAAILRQHVVAAEAIARGDLLFALSSGDPAPAEDDQLWLLPDGDSSAALTTAWQREAELMTADVPGVRCLCIVHSVHPLDEDALGRIAGMHVWSDDYLTRRMAAGEQLLALIVRAWAAPQPSPPTGHALELPASDDLLPALTDSAFELLVERLEQALRGPAAVRA
jgi:hypothetical protein